MAKEFFSLRQRVRLAPPKRSPDYYRMRRWWLSEICNLRAKQRVHGANIKKDRKAAQLALSRVRNEIYD